MTTKEEDISRFITPKKIKTNRTTRKKGFGNSPIVRRKSFNVRSPFGKCMEEIREARISHFEEEEEEGEEDECRSPEVVMMDTIKNQVSQARTYNIQLLEENKQHQVRLLELKEEYDRSLQERDDLEARFTELRLATNDVVASTTSTENELRSLKVTNSNLKKTLSELQHEAKSLNTRIEQSKRKELEMKTRFRSLREEKSVIVRRLNQRRNSENTTTRSEEEKKMKRIRNDEEQMRYFDKEKLILCRENVMNEAKKLKLCVFDIRDACVEMLTVMHAVFEKTSEKLLNRIRQVDKKRKRLEEMDFSYMDFIFEQLRIFGMERMSLVRDRKFGPLKLYRPGNWFNRWEDIYFEVARNDFNVKVFRSIRRDVLLDVMTLSETHLARGKGGVFVIRNPFRKIVLRARNEEEREQWIDFFLSTVSFA